MQTGPLWHAAIEMTGGLLGLIVGFALITRFHALGNRFHLFIGLAFCVNGAEDFAHGLLGFEVAHGLLSSTSADLKQFIRGTCMIGRLLLVLLLILAPFGNRLLGAGRNPRRETRSLCLVVFAIAVAATLLTFQIRLPDFIFPRRTISRPVDFLFAIALAAALVLFLREYRRDHHMLTWWISLAVGVNVVGQVLMSFSKEQFDAFFDVGHVYKTLGYAIPLLGFTGYQIAAIVRQKRTEQALLANQVQAPTVLDTVVDGLITINHRGRIESFNTAAQRAAELQKLNQELHKEIDERKQAEEALRKSEASYHQIFDAANDAFSLKQEVPKKEPKWQDDLRIIVDETAVADGIITGVSAMSRGATPIKKATPLRAIITKARLRLVKAETIRWRITCDPDPFLVHVNAAQLQQVLRNLFANSIQALGGAGLIQLEATRSAKYDQILVRDDGPGTPPQNQQRVFEPLYTGKPQSTGLGLAICRQIIERHGGTIEAVPRRRGAAFRIQLPKE